MLPVIESNEAALVSISFLCSSPLQTAPLPRSHRPPAHNSVYFCKLIFNLIYVSVGGPWGSSGNGAKVTTFTRQTQNKRKGNRIKIKVENKNREMQAYYNC